MISSTRLTQVENKILNQLQTELRDWLSVGWATIACRDDSLVHRGARRVSDHQCVIFGNDGFSTDVRSQVEVAQLAQELERLGIKIQGFGISQGEGCSWAMRIAFKDDWLLDRLVWHIWFVAVCGMTDNPATAELNTRLKLLTVPMPYDSHPDAVAQHDGHELQSSMD